MNRIVSLIRVLLGSLMLTAVAINFANVIGRYFFDKPIFWAEESMVFLQIWMVVVGAALVSHENVHLRMDAIEHLIPVGPKRWLDFLTDLTMIVAAITVVWVSSGVVLGRIANEERSIALEIPMAIPFAAIPIGFALIMFFTLLRLVRSARGKKASDTTVPGVRKSGV